MRTPENKTSKKKASTEVKVRKLKIQPKIRYTMSSYGTVPFAVPEIKLCGKWLEELGFVHGEEVLITTSDQMLVIKPK